MSFFSCSSPGWFYPSQALIQSQNDASAIAKLLYPQLLDKAKTCALHRVLLSRSFSRQVIIINAPWFFRQLWKIATAVLSESLTSKVGMCGGTIVAGELGKCPYASKHVATEGGTRESFCLVFAESVHAKTCRRL